MTPLAIATIEQNLWRAEIELLANLADGARPGLPIVAQLGITEDSFSDPANALIFCSMAWGLKVDKFARARCAARVLEQIGRWNPQDVRGHIPSVGVWRWGPGPLSALYTLVSYDERRLRAAARGMVILKNRVDLAREG